MEPYTPPTPTERALALLMSRAGYGHLTPAEFTAMVEATSDPHRPGALNCPVNCAYPGHRPDSVDAKWPTPDRARTLPHGEWPPADPWLDFQRTQ